MSVLPNRTDVDDLLQETNLVLWREFESFEIGTNFTAWAYRIAHNQVLAWRKPVKEYRDADGHRCEDYGTHRTH